MTWSYAARRFSYMVLLLVLSSILSFIIINLPPGDFLTSYIMTLEAGSSESREELAAALRAQYGLDQPVYVQYTKWMGKVVRGDFGMSFEWNRPVKDLVAERIPMTLVVSISTLIVGYLIAIPVGIYSATHQYSLGDMAATVFGFIGMAVPNFLFALFLMFMFYKYFNLPLGGLFSAQYQNAPWTWAKLADLLRHLWVPLIVVGLGSTAVNIRVMRANLLDELQRPYVETARAKGLPERRVILRYPVRVALNPIISGIGWAFPQILSGATIVSVVLGLPTVGPLLLRSLISQDMYVAGTITLFICALTVVGMFVSDLLLAVADPRIRLE
ncbi:MAG: ABC transporter permease [Chloroflexi bacterium]|nr:ABC transporter permease [Chloroflexota bacterium]